jgi:hypothetical protein
MQTARSTTVRCIAASHEGISVDRVRFGAPLTAVLPYMCVAVVPKFGSVTGEEIIGAEYTSIT